MCIAPSTRFRHVLFLSSRLFIINFDNGSHQVLSHFPRRQMRNIDDNSVATEMSPFSEFHDLTSWHRKKTRSRKPHAPKSNCNSFAVEDWGRECCAEFNDILCKSIIDLWLDIVSSSFRLKNDMFIFTEGTDGSAVEYVVCVCVCVCEKASEFNGMFIFAHLSVADVVDNQIKWPNRIHQIFAHWPQYVTSHTRTRARTYIICTYAVRPIEINDFLFTLEYSLNFQSSCRSSADSIGISTMTKRTKRTRIERMIVFTVR